MMTYMHLYNYMQCICVNIQMFICLYVHICAIVEVHCVYYYTAVRLLHHGGYTLQLVHFVYHCKGNNNILNLKVSSKPTVHLL